MEPSDRLVERSVLWSPPKVDVASVAGRRATSMGRAVYPGSAQDLLIKNSLSQPESGLDGVHT